MTPALVLIFVGGSADTHQADLDAWARARLVELRAPEPDSPAGLGYPSELAARIEELLESARLLSATLDDAGALQRLGRTERLLADHPELPQAPWLLAEVLDLRATIAERSGGSDAAELRRRAAALAGGRVGAYAPGAAAGDPSVPAPAAQRAVSGLSSGDTLYWDAERSGDKLSTPPGLHHARVLRRGRAVWAGWVEVSADQRAIALPVPAPAACSLDDVGATRIVAERVVPPRTARCARWAVARPGSAGGVEVATCRGAHCGPLLPWKQSFGAVYQGPPQPRAERGFPTWAAITLAGVGAAVVGGVVAWRAGAFDEPDGARTGWRFYGP